MPRKLLKSSIGGMEEPRMTMIEVEGAGGKRHWADEQQILQEQNQGEEEKESNKNKPQDYQAY